MASQQKLLGTEPLDIVKFICKEFWEQIFKKKVRRSDKFFDLSSLSLTFIDNLGG